MPHSVRPASSNSSLSLGSDSPLSSPEPLSPIDGSFNFDPFQTEPLPSDDGKHYIMVIGGLGYIGSHTALELLQQGYNVIIVDNLSNCYEGTLSRIRKLAREYCRCEGLMMPSLRFHKLDYRSPLMRTLFSRYGTSRSLISAVIHFAAYKSVSESIERPLAYYQNNICGLIELMATMQDYGVKNFVFSSSATVYGAKANGGKPLREQDLVHFDDEEAGLLNGSTGLTSPYGRTKFFAEAILADLAKAEPSMKITALRYFNPVGCHPSGQLCEDPRQKATNLFPAIVSAVKGDRPALKLFGSDWDTRDGTAIRDFIHVVDLAQGHVAALEHAARAGKREAFRTYNLGTGTGMTVAEVIASFEKASHIRVPVVMAGRRAGDVGVCVAATDRAETELGWRARRTVDECARDTWNALTVYERERS